MIVIFNENDDALLVIMSCGRHNRTYNSYSINIRMFDCLTYIYCLVVSFFFSYYFMANTSYQTTSFF